MPQHVVVLGMHRSYTTLLATWLHANGVRMFESGIPTPLYHEDPDIFRLHEEFFQSQQMNWLNGRAPFVDPSNIFRNRSYQLWMRRNSQNQHWGWKDPRTTILYDFLWTPFSENAKYIIVYRDPAEVLESLLVRKIKKRMSYRFVPERLYAWHLRRHRLSYDTAHLVCWNYYNRCILQLIQATKTEDYLLLDAHSIEHYDAEIYQRVSVDWGIELSGKPLSAFIKPMTIRQLPDLTSLNPLLTEETAEILNALKRHQTFKSGVNLTSTQ